MRCVSLLFLWPLREPARRRFARTRRELALSKARAQFIGPALHPGAGRRPAPRTQEQLGELIQAWIDSGAECRRSRLALPTIVSFRVTCRLRSPLRRGAS